MAPSLGWASHGERRDRGSGRRQAWNRRGDRVEAGREQRQHHRHLPDRGEGDLRHGDGGRHFPMQGLAGRAEEAVAGEGQGAGGRGSGLSRGGLQVHGEGVTDEVHRRGDHGSL